MVDYVPMTREGFEKLKAELDLLENVKLPEVAQRVANARAEGDLRENAEYHGARETQGQLQGKANELRDRLSRAEIVDPTKLPKGEVVFGCTVRVLDMNEDTEESYTLVGAGDENFDEGKIQVNSPLAQGLLGHKKGDVVKINVPAGLLKLKIEEISYPF